MISSVAGGGLGGLLPKARKPRPKTRCGAAAAVLPPRRGASHGWKLGWLAQERTWNTGSSRSSSWRRPARRVRRRRARRPRGPLVPKSVSVGLRWLEHRCLDHRYLRANMAAATAARARAPRRAVRASCPRVCTVAAHGGWALWARAARRLRKGAALRIRAEGALRRAARACCPQVYTEAAHGGKGVVPRIRAEGGRAERAARASQRACTAHSIGRADRRSLGARRRVCTALATLPRAPPLRPPLTRRH